MAHYSSVLDLFSSIRSTWQIVKVWQVDTFGHNRQKMDNAVLQCNKLMQLLYKQYFFCNYLYKQSSPAWHIIFFVQLDDKMFARISNVPLIPSPPEQNKWSEMMLIGFLWENVLSLFHILPVHDLLFEQLLVTSQPPQQLLHGQLDVGVVGWVRQQVLWTNLLLMLTILLLPLS